MRQRQYQSLKNDIESLNQEKESAIQEEAFEKAGEIKKKQDRKQAQINRLMEKMGAGKGKYALTGNRA